MTLESSEPVHYLFISMIPFTKWLASESYLAMGATE